MVACCNLDDGRDYAREVRRMVSVGLTPSRTNIEIRVGLTRRRHPGRSAGRGESRRKLLFVLKCAPNCQTFFSFTLPCSIQESQRGQPGRLRWLAEEAF